MYIIKMIISSVCKSFLEKVKLFMERNANTIANNKIIDHYLRFRIITISI